MVLFFIFSFGAVYASDNVTEDFSLNSDAILENEVCVFDNVSANQIVNDDKVNTKIESSDINSYYKEKNELVSYLKDDMGNPVQNKTLSILLNGKTYDKTTDAKGSVKLGINLKPGNYDVLINFAGDDAYNQSTVNTQINIKKIQLAIKTSDCAISYKSDKYFTAKVYNDITGTPIKGIKVLFKVYSHKTKKFTNFYKTTNENGIATLNKNLQVGLYTIYTQIKDSKNKKFISYKNSKNKATLTVKPSAGDDCCSFYVQVSDTESVCGFRRDNVGDALIKVKTSKNWYGKTAVRHYKDSGSYFCHLVATSDGWMMGNGGLDDVSVVKNIEKLAADMMKSNKIKMSSLKKIRMYKRWANFGHFSIKAPDGRYAVVYQGSIQTGKLKPGEFLCNPNFKSYQRHGTYAKYGTNPAKVAIKVGATDHYGIYRRQITIFHWKATTKNYKTTAKINVHAANDNGRLVGRSSAHYVDNIEYQGKFVSKYKLPKSPNSIRLGTLNFGNIDKLIKTPTTIKAPNVVNQFNNTKYFKVTVKNKNTKKVVKGIKIKVQVTSGSKSKSYTLKTDNKGVAKFDTKTLNVGNYSVVISSANNKYLISGKSKIVIEAIPENITEGNSTVDVPENVSDGNSTVDVPENVSGDDSENVSDGNSTVDVPENVTVDNLENGTDDNSERVMAGGDV